MKNKKRIFTILILTLFITQIFVTSVNAQTPELKNYSNKTEDLEEAKENSDSLKLEAKSALLVEPITGKIVYEKIPMKN